MAENTTQQGEIFRSLDEGWFREEVQGRWVGRDRILKSLVTIWTMESLTNFSEVSLAQLWRFSEDWPGRSAGGSGNK